MKYGIVLPTMERDEIIVNPETGSSKEVRKYIHEYIKNSEFFEDWNIVDFNNIETTDKYKNRINNEGYIEMVSTKNGGYVNSRGGEFFDISFAIEAFIIINYNNGRGDVNIYYSESNSQQSDTEYVGAPKAKGFDSVYKLEQDSDVIENVEWESVINKMDSIECIQDI